MLGFTRDFWRRLLPLIPRWHALTLPQRVAALGMPHGFHDPLHAFRSLSPEQDAFCFDTDRTGQKRATQDFQFLAAFVKRLGSWSKPAGADLRAYAQAATTMAQRLALTGMRPGSGSEPALQAFLKRFKDGAFGRALLASDAPGPFIRAAGGWVPGGEDFGTAEFRSLREWFLQATRKGGAAYILDAGALGDPKGALEPAALLELALGYGLAIVYRREGELLPCFAVAAPAAVPAHKPGNVVMTTVPAADPFRRPFAVDDIDAWLRSLKSHPAPLLDNGFGVPVAHLRKVAKAFIPLPPWLPDPGFTAEDRAGAAQWLILRLELASSFEDKHKALRLGLAPKGEAWLGSSREEKLALALKAAPVGTRSPATPYDTFAYLGDYLDNPVPYEATTPLVFEWLREAFAALAGPVSWQEFRNSACAKANPFVHEADRDPALDGEWARSAETPEQVYSILMHRYAGRLAGLGALGFAEAGPGRAAVLPTPIGDWLFGRAEGWKLPEGRKGIAVVGADFTVTLLEKSAEAEVELSGFAEAEGKVFRITKESVQAAAHAGRAAASMLEALESMSKHALPANVAHEIREWARAKKTVRVEEALLIEGDDPVVLAEIRAAFPKDFAPVGAAALKYLGKGSRESVLRRLAKKGFFAA